MGVVPQPDGMTLCRAICGAIHGTRTVKQCYKAMWEILNRSDPLLVGSFSFPYVDRANTRSGRSPEWI